MEKSTMEGVATRAGKPDPAPPPPVPESAAPEITPRSFINRELSWLQFNDRVLEEALDRSHPLLERVKFHSIFASNLDEFFMIRVSGLRQQLAAGVLKTPPDGMTPAEQLAAIRNALLPKVEGHADCWSEELLPELRDEGICILSWDQLKKKQRKLLRQYFRREVFPVLTPLAFDPGHPFPHISNLSMNLAVVIHDPEHGERFARLKVPGALPRLLRVPSEDRAEDVDALGLAEVKTNNFVWIEQLIAANLDLLFPGLEVVASYPFRVTRDADQEIEEDEASDLLTTIEESLRQRHFGSAIRLEVDGAMSDLVRDILVDNLELAPYQVYTVDGPLGMADVMELAAVDRPDLKDPPFQPAVPPVLSTSEGIFSVVSRRDVLLVHPYDSFSPVVDFVSEAAEDEDVLAIKQTLYRVGANSPVVQALMRARENGKQVAALVELKARFDEENNIVWARALEDAGVHVVYGVVGLKTHAKICLVVRRERGRIVHHVHLSTGNYNDVTAKVYSDIGYFTSDPEICADAARLFNALTGYSRDHHYDKLLVAPGRMREEIIDRIRREIAAHEEHGDGYLAFKMNALVDHRCIEALYAASRAGVKVDLDVRGICCLVPGVAGMSENIAVRSIVGRFLEHARMYYFRNGGDDEVLLGSADLMPRNLDHRVETLFPVEDDLLRSVLRDEILGAYLRDNVKARQLGPDGSWERVHPEDGEEPFSAQEWLLEHRGTWSLGE